MAALDDRGHGDRVGAGSAVLVRELGPSRTRWSYALEPVDGGTRVVESMFKADPQAAPIRFLQKLVGATDREAIVRDGMETTLERLEAAVA